MNIEPQPRPSVNAEILADALLGLLLTAVVVLLKVGFERTMPGEQLEQAMYSILQLKLMPGLNERDMPIVVDITGMPMVRAEKRELDYTSREALKGLIEKLNAKKPRAIGIDVDFTPYAEQRKADECFLNYCMTLRHPKEPSSVPPLPVFVGVYDSLAYGKRCLGKESYSELAAFVGFPTSDERQLRKRMVDMLQVVDSTGNPIWSCPSLASATSNTHMKPKSRWIAWALAPITFPIGHIFSSAQFVIDYSALEDIEKTSLRWDSDDFPPMAGRIVLVGRGNKSSTGDKYNIPGRPGSTHAGVYVHACAAYTLLKGALYTLNCWGRLALDLVISFAIIFIIVAVRLHVASAHFDVDHARLHYWLTIAAVVATVVVGYVLVNVTRFLWDDFFFVAVALILHRWLETLAEPVTRPIAGLFDNFLKSEFLARIRAWPKTAPAGREVQR